MKAKYLIALLFTHGGVFAFGFALGIYLLPILTAPESPAVAEVETVAAANEYQGMFTRDLEDSDALHWGEGTLTIGSDTVSFTGELAPGPDYMLYLSPEFVETEAEFAKLKSQMVRIGSIKTFDRFLLELPEGVDPSDYNTAIVWCESFGEFISAATYSRR